jgi:AsmA family/AsmA-like C-terminal region
MRVHTIKKLLLALGAIALIVVTSVVALLLFDINTIKSNIESVVLDETGLVVRIRGKMELSFSPFGVSARDIHVTNRGTEITSLENLKLGVELLPLVKKQIKVTRCELVKPVFTIVKDANGQYNFESTGKRSTGVPSKVSFNVNDFKLSKGRLVYLDQKTGEKTEMKEFNLAVNDFSMPGNLATRISCKGIFDCREVQHKGFIFGNIKATVKAVNGACNFEPLSIGAIVYTDKQTAEKTELKEVRLGVSGLTRAYSSRDIVKDISFTGNLECKEVRKGHIQIDNIKSPVTVAHGVTHLSHLVLDIFGAPAVGDASMDTSESDFVYNINVKVAKLDVANLEETFRTKRIIGGKADLHASLTMKERKNQFLLSSMSGSVSLRSDNLVTYTMDLDKILTSYESSQEFNLVDLGAFFIAGPLSTLAVRGFRSGDLYNQTRGGQGTITQFISHWQIKDGIAVATDCALSTKHNRVALKGKLDLVNKRYENVTVALLDNEGCAKFKQSIGGSFIHPRIGSVSVVNSLSGPIVNLFSKTKRFIQGGKCEVFYSGAVRQSKTD